MAEHVRLDGQRVSHTPRQARNGRSDITGQAV
jgi:hypothetical protein